MNILYLTIVNIDLKGLHIYSDLVNELTKRGHKVTIVDISGSNQETHVINEENCRIIKMKMPSQYGVNFIKKALIILKASSTIKKGVKKYINDEDFDLIIYQTPPITFLGALKFLKKKYKKAKLYLMLKDIFPQNAVDMGLFSTKGPTSIIHKYFRRVEKGFYKISDKIGCMSKGNIDYVLEHNPEVLPNKLEMFPNTVKVLPLKQRNEELLEKYGIDKNKKIFLFGGNLGIMQGLDFFIEAVKKCQDISSAQFVVVGKGSEKDNLFKQLRNLNNVVTLGHMSSNEYAELCACCDVGLVMLSHLHTIPNYPSRALSYFQCAKPILACTDAVTDFKDLFKDNKLGIWCEALDLDGFYNAVKFFCENEQEAKLMGERGREYLINNFNVEMSADILEDFIKQCNKGG